MIVKIQRSLATSHSQATALIYNRDRSVLYECPLHDDLEGLFGEREFTIYCHAGLNEKQQLVIGRKLRNNPDW